MKKLFFLTWMLWMCGATIWAQVPKFRVSEWMLGHYNNINYYKLDFSSGSPVLSTKNYNCVFNTIGNSISDSANNLLLYTNGVVLMNQDYNLIPGCENFNGGYDHALDSLNARVFFTTLLPDPGNRNRFYVFHNSTGDHIVTNYMSGVSRIRFSLLDMSLNNGQGGLVIKDSTWIKDTLSGGAINGSQLVVRHANGRDWWLLFYRSMDDAVYRTLLSPQGLSQPQLLFGPGGQWPLLYNSGYGITIKVSPDGSKYALMALGNRFGIYQGLTIYDFDRCTGLSSNPKLIYKPTLNDAGMSFCFSPNSQLLYLGIHPNIWQYNLQDSFPDSTRVLVYSTSLNIPLFNLLPSPTADETKKIYICRQHDIGMIHSPDVIGVGCNATDGDIPLTNTAISYPYHPYYELGPLIGSGCDTLTSSIGTAVTAAKVEVYPNPTDGEITVAFESKYGHSGRFMCYNPLGQVCKAIDLAHSPSKVSLSDLPTGLYFWEFEGQKGKLWVR